MYMSITRKFLVNTLPDLSGKEKTVYERYYLYISKTTVLRIQSVNDNYELERKVNESELVREGQTLSISKQESERLKAFSMDKILRDSYQVSDSPKVVIRIYHDKFEGLIRAEVNFQSESESKAFVPLSWMGKEITGTPLSQDGYLLQLTPEEFQKLIT